MLILSIKQTWKHLIDVSIGCVELGIQRPDLVGVFGLVSTHRSISGPGPLLSDDNLVERPST